MPVFEEITNSNKVLLVEDNPADARLVELLLAESDLLNCTITVVDTLESALTTLDSEDDYSAILLDLSLPDSRGFVTLEKLINRFPDNNVIVLTGLSDKNLGVDAVKAGAQDFLIKGAFDADILAKSLRYSIERSHIIKRLEETQRIANIGNWEYDPTTKEFIGSDELYRIFGYPPRSTFFHFREIEDSNHPFHVFKNIHELTIANKTYRNDIRIKTIDGQTRYVFVQCNINTNAKNNLVVNGIIQDVHERKKADQRYQDIFTKSRDAVYIANLNGEIIDFNLATTELLGLTSEELRTINFHNCLHAEDRKESFISRIMERRPVSDFEVEIQRKDGTKRSCLISANFLDSDNTEALNYNGIIRDITEKKQADELRKARDVARQSAKLKETFIASISHEMRTPMNAILGMSNLVIKTQLSTEQYNYISSIKQSSEILLGIVNDILEISTIQNGKLTFEDKDFDLHELLNNLVNVMQYKITEKDLGFELNIDPLVPRYIKGDKLRLNQILFNLVGNAVKFTDKGCVKINIDNLFGSDGSVVQIKFEVEDSGIGIPADKLAAIFESFTRVRTKDRIYEGTGLGLSIAKNLIEQQGGKIGVESEVGVGSKFFFDLIFEKGEAVSDELVEKDEITRSVNNDRTLNLLLVEDHKMNQLVARKTLEKQWPNINITIADNGQIAVDILNKNEKTFDIILMDIQMPVMDGYEATKHIRENMPPAIAKLPILAMTAHAHISKDEKFKEYGMDNYVLKPFEPDELFYKIAKYTKDGNKSNGS